MKYSIKKFTKFSTERKIKKIYDWLNYIFNNRTDSELWKKEFQNLAILQKGLERSENEFLKKIAETKLNEISEHSLQKLIILGERFIEKKIKDHDFIILSKDSKRKNKEKFPIYIILDNLRSAFNVGSFFRTCECIGAKEIILVGQTITPKHRKIKSAMGTEKFVHWKHFSEMIEAINYVKEKQCTIYALETTKNAKSHFETNFKKPTALVFGNEALGLEESTLKLVDEVVKIPVFGWKNSLNVGVSFAIVGYKIIEQWKK